ncbi:MAG: hypothetical protein K5641_08445 [Lachnospiraceae bacterium]|nr:hypothetical protein [Lachnospiraceae bacterium]
MDRCLLLYQHIIEDIGSHDYGSTYDYIPWLKGQTWLYGSIDRNTNQKLSDPTLRPLVGDVGDYGLSGFIDLAKDYMQKTTWLKEGELYDLFQELYVAGSNAERKVVACEIYRYLYEGPDMPIPIQAGAERGEGNRINIMVHKMNSARLGLSDIDVTTEEGADDAIGAAGAAIARISAIRSKIGAQQNRLEHTIKHQKNTVENTQAAESRIRDTDMAEEMVRYAKESILQQAGQSMLAQANHSTEGILALLR